jgi:acyl-CoA hydrolase
MTTDSHVDDINEDLSDEDEVIKPVLEEIITKKPKRIMSEKQLENLKKAREIAKIKLNEKKKQTIENKRKEDELKLLQKLEKNQTIDKQLEDLKKIVIKSEPEKEPPSIPKIDDDIIYIKKTRKPKKKVVYISETDSDDEEVVYKKKSKKKEAIIQDLNIKDVRKKDDEKLLEKQYNDKLSKIKQEFLMDQLFPK